MEAVGCDWFNCLSCGREWMYGGYGDEVVFFIGRRSWGDGQQTVFVNDFYKGDVNGEEEAYNLIEKELGIQPLKLGYIPSDMYFLDVYIKDGYARLCFTYNDEFVYLSNLSLIRRYHMIINLIEKKSYQ